MWIMGAKRGVIDGLRCACLLSVHGHVSISTVDSVIMLNHVGVHRWCGAQCTRRCWLTLHRADIGVVTIVLALETEDGHILLVVLLVLSEELDLLFLSQFFFLTIRGFVAQLTTIVTANSCHWLYVWVHLLGLRLDCIFVGPVLIIGEVSKCLESGVLVSNYSFHMDLLAIRPLRTKPDHIVDADVGELLMVEGAWACENISQLAKPSIIVGARLVAVKGTRVSSPASCSSTAASNSGATRSYVLVLTSITFLAFSILKEVAARRYFIWIHHMKIFALFTFLALSLHPMHAYRPLSLGLIYFLIL